MESNGVKAGMLGLEMPLHSLHQQNHPSSHNFNSNPHQQQYSNQQHQQMVSFTAHDTNHNTHPPQYVKSTYPTCTTKAKQPQQQQMAFSDEDEPGCTADDGSGDGRKRGSPWHRVKWTDNMVRLLIMVVFYIGDDACPEGNETQGMSKKKSGAMLQKKGKWKSVSKAMMEKGFSVSPQQCEDKFNDLNKRYKRVNDILGKGTACKVVENQSLLDTMDQLSPKMKDEARKLLNSKHLFFREMCAYHNSGGAVGAHQSCEGAIEITRHQQQGCSHPSDGVQTANSRRMVRHEEDDEDVDDDDEDEEEDSEDDEDMEDVGGSRRCLNEHSGGHEDGSIIGKLSSKKKQRGMSSLSAPLSPSIQQLSFELMSVLQDGRKSPLEQKQWMRNRSIQLEEQRVNYQCQAFELEKQHMKWVKFSWKKEREMERMKLNNERMRLENERMVLLLRQKELEILDLHRQQRSSS